MKYAYLFVTLLIGISSLPIHALDYFGDIKENRLVLKLEAESSGTRQWSGSELPCYIVLHEGVPVLSKQARPTESEIEYGAGTMEILRLYEIPPGERPLPDESAEEFERRILPKLKGELYLIFEFPQGGWAADEWVKRVKIPYSTDLDDPKQMLQISSKGTMEKPWHDPIGDAVTVVSYWGSIGAPIPIKVEVIESTLGFQNKLNRE